MARARIGGRSANIRGKLGNNIFRLRRLADGRLIDTSYAVPATKADPNTNAQASARMIMGQIERMFHVLPTIIKDGNINVSRGPLSLQQFARLNYPLLVNDVNVHFNGSNDFDWRPKYDLSAPAGPWILTQGNIPSLHYDSLHFYHKVNDSVEVGVVNPGGEMTVGQLLDYMNLKQGDTLIFFLYRKNSPFTSPFIFQVRFNVSTNIPLTMLVRNCYENDIIVPDDDTVAGSEIYSSTGNFAIYWDDSNTETPYQLSCWAPLIIRQQGDTQLFSSAQFAWGETSATISYYRNCPNDVISSWKDL